MKYLLVGYFFRCLVARAHPLARLAGPLFQFVPTSILVKRVTWLLCLANFCFLCIFSVTICLNEEAKGRGGKKGRYSSNFFLNFFHKQSIKISILVARVCPLFVLAALLPLP